MCFFKKREKGGRTEGSKGEREERLDRRKRRVRSDKERTRGWKLMDSRKRLAIGQTHLHLPRFKQFMKARRKGVC